MAERALMPAATRLAAALVVLAAAACAVTAACTGGGGAPGPPAACDTVFDTDTPDVCPSWSAQVEPLFATYCNQCHTDGGNGQTLFNASTYHDVFVARGQVTQFVGNCNMPLQDASPPVPQPSDPERQTIISWVACNAPDN
ncbi:MAG: hypothetical protein ACRELB_13235 [Polyangiaceae bacterium]